MSTPVQTPGDPSVATFETQFARLVIDSRGRCSQLVEKSSGKHFVVGSDSLFRLHCGDGTSRDATCSCENGRLMLDFPGGAGTAVITVTPKDRYFVFEVASLDSDEADELTFLALVPSPSRYVNHMSSLAADDELAVCVRALNLQTLVTIGDKPPLFRASSFRDYGFQGAKAALVACPAAHIRDVLKQVVREEGLPYSRLGGPFALDAVESCGSYLFASVSEGNVDDWINLTRRAGFTHVHFSGWWQSLGHYAPGKELFPNGLAGMKETVRKIHAAGLKAGMHTLTGCIATNDPWVTPVPEKRLVPDAVYTLAADMDRESKIIRTVERPGEHDTVWSYSGNGNVIRIDEELIHYSAISRDPPYGFLNCTRGAFGTRVHPQAKGASADHLQQRYLAFYPDENSALLDEVADAIARVYNECEMDEIYMDGAEGMRAWHPVALMRKAIYDRLRRPALVEASSWGHHSWPFHSRVGAWDHPKWGLKRFVDMHCESALHYRKSALVEAQLGWWAILGHGDYFRSEMPDEIEYLCCKTLAMNAPMSIQGVTVGTRPPNARQNEYFTTVGRYERLRLARYFTDELRERLAEPGQEFQLQQAIDGEWEFRPVAYDTHKVTSLTDGSAEWTAVNTFGEQPVRLRIEALYAAAAYDSNGSLPMVDYADVGAYDLRQNAPGVTHTFETVIDNIRAGEVSACFSATNNGTTAYGAWARAGRGFEPHLDMGPCEAFGLWIHGDGKGEVLNIQLSNPREYSHAYAEHYVTIDFTGWKYVELLLRERSAARYHDYKWPYFSQHGIFRNRLVSDHVHELNFYLNNLPPGETATVLLSPIRAVPTSRLELRHPGLEAAGSKLQFPVSMHSGWYIEFESMSDCCVYDERGVLQQRLIPRGQVPSLTKGSNRLSFTCEGPPEINARAEITVTSSGRPIRGRRPDSEPEQQWLDREYEYPRHVLALDGKENEWDVLCRPGADSADLELELRVEFPPGAACVSEDAHTPANQGDLNAFADPAFTVAGRRVVFPVSMSAGDRLVFRNMQDCRLHPKGEGNPRTVTPEGSAPQLEPGLNRVRLDAAPGSPKELHITASLVKVYR